VSGPGAAARSGVDRNEARDAAPSHPTDPPVVVQGGSFSIVIRDLGL
jgi:hypothetical protein